MKSIVFQVEEVWRNVDLQAISSFARFMDRFKRRWGFAPRWPNELSIPHNSVLLFGRSVGADISVGDVFDHVCNRTPHIDIEGYVTEELYGGHNVILRVMRITMYD